MRLCVPTTLLLSILGLTMSALLSGCLAGKTGNVSALSAQSGLPFPREAMSATSYRDEIQKWQDSVQKTTVGKEKAEAHLHLAALYLAKDNPQKDYHNGLVHLTKAASAWPELNHHLAFVSWLELLTRFETEQRKAEKDQDALKNNLARLQQQNANQRQDIVKLRETLDKLKMLEMSVERKRRAFK